MSVIDLKSYFDDVTTFKFGEKEFKVNESVKTYQLYQVKVKEITEKGINDDNEILQETFKSAFGEDYEEFAKLELPAKAYNDIAIKIMSAWSGVSEEVIKRQMNMSIEGAGKTPSGSSTK